MKEGECLVGKEYARELGVKEGDFLYHKIPM